MTASNPSDVVDVADVADAVVIGSGPNGLVAAERLARTGWSVVVVERSPFAGGSVRSDELTLPGFVHDTHSAFYGLLHASPVFRDLDLGRRLEWARHESPVAAMVAPDVGARVLHDPAATAAALGTHDSADHRAWLDLWRWWDRRGRHLLQAMLSPIPPVRSGLRFARAAGIRGALDTAKLSLEPLEEVAARRFRHPAARALVACGVSHTDLAVDATGSTPGALFLVLVAQELGMPIPVGGAGRLAEAMVSAVEERGGTVVTGAEVRRVIVERGRAVGVELADGRAIRARRAVLADTGVTALCRDLVGEAHFPSTYLDGLRKFRHGTGIFKLDLALDGPVPWSVEGMDAAGVVHVTGTLDDMARAAFEARRGLLPAAPLLVVGQQSVADRSRAPEGGHTLWIETHVPPVVKGDGAGEITGQSWDAVRAEFAERVVDRLDKHAPGLRDRVRATAVRTPLDLQADNPNLVGGDLAGGTNAVDGQLVFRPVPGWFRYRTPVRRLYLCSASAHPGGGVHGMVGRNCARRVLADARLIPWR